jgi:predicted AlkP superfamily phosphohydrolase/phosphomutase
MGVRVLLIGLDGATFSVLDPMIARGVMPFLGSLLAGGVRAPLRTIVPALTPPAWTSLVTGRSPGHHGVFDFFRMDGGTTGRHIRFATSRDVGVPTLWETASAAGLRVTALNFPLTFPPPPVSGHVVPGWVPWRQLRLACHPPGLFDRLKALPGFEPRELAMDIKLEERATEGCSRPEEYAPWIEFHTRREARWFEIFRHLHRTEPSELTAVLFDGVDKLQHLCWRFIDGEAEESRAADWERQARELCLDYFRHLDRLVERMCGMAGPEAAVFIASDHGFGPTRQVFHLNAWLERHGYLAWSAEGRAGARPEALLGVGQVARHTFLMDWERTAAFATTPTSNGIFIVRGDGNGRGVPDADYEPFRQRLARELQAESDPATGEPLVRQIHTREQAFPGPFGSLAPDLTLSLADGGLVSILPSERMVSARPAVAGSHRPVGVLMAAGRGVRRGAEAAEVSILDVAPTLLYALGLPVPEEMEGRVLEEVFDAETLGRRPVERERERAADGPPPPAPSYAPAFGPAEEAILLKRLQELGYVE